MSRPAPSAAPIRSSRSRSVSTTACAPRSSNGSRRAPRGLSPGRLKTRRTPEDARGFVSRTPLPFMSVILARNIVKNYRLGEVDVEVLKGIDLDVEPGEYVALMGPSGSGKSTLMNILGCLDVPTSGLYSIEGHPVSDLSDDELAVVRGQRIGFVFQTFNLLARTSALENVELPLHYQGRPARTAAMQALEAVNLAHRHDHHPSQLSG